MSKIVEFLLRAKDQTAAAFSSAGKRVDDLEEQIKKLSKSGDSVKDMFKNIAGAISLGAMKDFIKSNAAAAASIDDNAKLAGVSAEKFQELAFASDNAGGSSDLMSKALVHLNKELAKARAGDKKAKAIFADFYVDPKKVKDSEDALLKIADAVQRAGDSPEELGKLEALLGKLKIDPAFIQTLQLGSEGIREFGEYARDAGVIIDGQTVGSLADLDDKLQLIEKRSAATAMVFVGALEPALTDLSNVFISSKQNADDLRSAGEFLGNALRGIAIAADLGVVGAAALGRALYVLGNSVLNYLINKVDATVTGFRRLASIGANILSQDFSESDRLESEYQKRALDRRSDTIKTWEDQTTKSVGAVQRALERADKLAMSTASGGIADPYKKVKPTSTEEQSKVTPLGSSALRGKGGGRGKKDDLAKANIALAKAEAEAEANVRIQVEKGLQDRIKNMLDFGEITYADYYKQLITSQQVAIDLRVEALKKEAAEEQKLIDSSTAKEKDRVEARAKLAKITGEIKVKELERGEIAGKAANEQRKSEEELARSLLDVQVKTKTILGTLSDADRRKVTEQAYIAARREAMRGGQSVAPIEEAINIETAKANFDYASGKISQAKARLDSQTAAIQADTTKSSMQMRVQIVEANQAAQKSIEDLLPAFRKQAELLGGEYIDKLRDAETELQNLKNTADTVAKSLNDDIQSQLSDAIASVANGEKSPAQALKDLFKGVGKSIGKMVADDLSSTFYTMLKGNGFNIGQMLSNLLSGSSSKGGGSDVLGDFIKSKVGGGSSGSDTGATVAGLWAKFAGVLGFETGGYTGDGGTSAPAGVVHGQEFVFSAPSVRALGVPFLEAMHSRARGSYPKSGNSGFEDGGYVSPSRLARDSARSGARVNMTVVTKDAASFRNSAGQVEARMMTAASRSLRRNS